jgi:hypothetical protein
MGAWHFAAAFLLVVLAVLAVVTSVLFSGLACSGDSSQCASSSDKNGVYEGTVVRQDGVPFRSGTVLVEFASRSSVGEPRVAFHTDDRGLICFRWANEALYPKLFTQSGAPLFARYQGYAYASEGPAASLGEWRDLEGRSPPPRCGSSDAGIPWYRAGDASGQWQAWLLLALPFAAFLLGSGAMAGYRERKSRRLLRIGWAVLVADALAFPLLWHLI